MPSLGADMEAGRLIEWLVKPGDNVSRGDIVAVVETQKGAIEIEIFEEGTVSELTAKLDAELPVGAPMAVILKEGEAPPAQPEAPPGPNGAPPTAPAPTIERPPTRHTAVEVSRVPQSVTGAAVRASPAARQRAQELGVEISRVSGSGPGGVIVLSDIEAEVPSTSAAPETTPRSPMAEMRHAIAAAMARSKQTIPHFYLSETIDVQPAMDFLAHINASRPPAERILLIAPLARAVALAAAQVKSVNGHFVDGSYSPSKAVNTGIAVALRGGGLVAPALMDSTELDLEQTMAGIRDLVTRARSGRLRSSEMTAGTITVSSLGETGAESMTGVIFPPQATLVSVGAPHERPWVVEGTIVPRMVVSLTVSADHRVSDGRQIAKFIATVETLLKTPENL